MKKIVLLDGYSVQAYSVSKSLRKAGFHVSLLSHTRIGYGFFSKYPHTKFLAPKSNSTLFKNYFIELQQEYKFDLAIPLCDEGAQFLSYNKELLKKHSLLVAVPQWDIFKVASDKQALLAICQRNGLGHPRTTAINESNIDEAIKYVGFPSLIKPDFSMGARGITRVNSKNDITRVLKSLIDTYGSCTLQEFIVSNESYYNVMMYRGNDGSILATAAIEITRFFPIKGGSSCFAKSVEIDELTLLCQQALDVLGWTGFADFDVLYDSRDSKFKIIEINPRIPACIEAAYISGVNFPAIIAQRKLIDKSYNSSHTYITGMYLRYFTLDLAWFIFSSKRFKTRPCWFNFNKKYQFYQDAGKDDPFVVFAGLLDAFRKIFSINYLKSKFKG